MEAEPRRRKDPQGGDVMIRHTVRDLAKKLEQLSRYQIPIARSLDLLESRARTVEEIVVIEVMRESYEEMALGLAGSAVQADSSSRTARMPAMAFRR
jgi:hypothetical protein